MPKKKKEALQEVVNEEVIEEIVNTVKPGVAVNCVKLNVRKEASKEAEILCTIDENTEVVVDLNQSTEDFYKVVTAAGAEGYCVKEFINIK